MMKGQYGRKSKIFFRTEAEIGSAVFVSCYLEFHIRILRRHYITSEYGPLVIRVSALSGKSHDLVFFLKALKNRSRNDTVLGYLHAVV